MLTSLVSNSCLKWCSEDEKKTVVISPAPPESCRCCALLSIPASHMEHIIIRLTCWGWLCMVSGGGVGTGLGAQAGCWDWEASCLPPRLLAWPRSFWKVFTACVGWNRKLPVKQIPSPFPQNYNIKTNFCHFLLLNSPVEEIYLLSRCQGRHLIGYKLGRCDDLSPARWCGYLSERRHVKTSDWRTTAAPYISSVIIPCY